MLYISPNKCWDRKFQFFLLAVVLFFLLNLFIRCYFSGLPTSSQTIRKTIAPQCWSGYRRCDSLIHDSRVCPFVLLIRVFTIRFGEFGLLQSCHFASFCSACVLMVLLWNWSHNYCTTWSGKLIEIVRKWLWLDFPSKWVGLGSPLAAYSEYGDLTCSVQTVNNFHLFNYQWHVYHCNWGPYVRLAFVPNMSSF